MALANPYPKPLGPLIANQKRPNWKLGGPQAGNWFNSGSTGTGVYRVSASTTGQALLPAGTTIASFRWTAPAENAVIQKLKGMIIATTGFTGAQIIDVGVYFARSWTQSDELGRAVVGAVTNSQEYDSRYGQSEINPADCRIADTSFIVPGIRTLDSQPLFTIHGWEAASGVGAIGKQEYELNFGTYLATNPIVLKQNEGLVFNIITALGAAGVAKFYFEMEWLEVDSQRN